jgi:NAD(P)-dependent dehydrogenase (short-subunit alcohol dehydrogenase family)
MASKDLLPYNVSTLKLFIQSQFRTKPQPPPSSITLAGKTALVTGSNIGIGLECCRQFLRFHVSHIILGVRSIEKGEQVAAPLREAYPRIEIEVWPLDMLSYESIQAFTERCRKLPQLDIAVLNAGMTRPDFVVNPSTSHEEMLQVNYLSTALLAIRLLPILNSHVSKTPGRLTIVSSGVALISQFPNLTVEPLLPSFDDGKRWDLNAANERYSVSKTLLLMLVSKLSELVDSTKVVINTVDPGFVGGSGLHRNMGGPLRAVFGIMKLLSARSLQQGAWTYVDAAVVKGKETHGCFIMDWKITPYVSSVAFSSRDTDNRRYHSLMYTIDGKKATERLWEETLQELEFAKVRDIISSLS